MVEAKTLKLPEESTGKCLHSKKGHDLESKSHKGGERDKSSFGKIKNISSGKAKRVKTNTPVVSWEIPEIHS